MRTHAWSTLVLLALVGDASAQQAPHVCGAGPGPDEVMAGVQSGGNGMAPTPLCYWKSQPRQPQQAPRPTGYWEKTWGAIATSETGDALGTAVGLPDRAQAERIAMQDCKAKGGGGCRVDLTYHNQCAVMVVGNRQLGLSRAASIDEATQDAIGVCNAKGDSCRVYYSACTEQIFHRY